MGLSPTPPDENARPVLVSKSDAAQQLSVSERTVERYARSGRLTKYSLGPKSVRFDLLEIRSISRPVPYTDGGAA